MQKRDRRFRETPRVFDKSGYPTVDLIGQRFGRLTVVEWAGKTGVTFVKKDITDFWVCQCDCGNPEYNPVLAASRWLKSGNTSSCGCKSRKHKKHGTRVYHTWSGLFARCYNPKDNAYHNYGGRGITVCDRWRESFENFYADMGDPPTDEHTLDRIDNNKGYSPENCRWATRKEQGRNTRRNLLITWRGETKTPGGWSEDERVSMLGITQSTICSRLRKGWSAEDTLTTPGVMGKLVTFRGETLSMIEWSRRLGAESNIVSKRLRAGWSVEEALTNPPGRGERIRRTT